MVGAAIATIVWSMNIIATANTIAVRTTRLFVELLMGASLRGRWV